MTPSEIKRMHLEGHSPADILRDLVASGWDFPDASAKVATVLRLDDEEAQEMRDNYDDCI